MIDPITIPAKAGTSTNPVIPEMRSIIRDLLKVTVITNKCFARLKATPIRYAAALAALWVVPVGTVQHRDVLDESPRLQGSRS
jgi:hypothetical protein